VFAGDVHFMDRTAALLKNPSTAFGSITPTLADADLTIVNLETAITSRGTPEPKTYHFRTVPTSIDALKAAGIDAVSIANNHTLDYGQVGLLDTLDALSAASYPAFGAGRTRTRHTRRGSPRCAGSASRCSASARSTRCRQAGLPDLINRA
jgi:poly-gamma-glutamate synthesis protein (capsule biosynthesis protein)